MFHTEEDLVKQRNSEYNLHATLKKEKFITKVRKVSDSLTKLFFCLVAGGARSDTGYYEDLYNNLNKNLVLQKVVVT